MLAAHAGSCHKCNGAIAAGEPVRSFNRPALGTWYHPACVGSKVAPTAPVALTASVTPSTVSGNGHAPSAAATLAPSAVLSPLDSLASALAPRDAGAACPCDWIGADYGTRCAWLLAAVADTRMALDSWRASALAELTATASLAATPDTARDLECYFEGLRHGLRLMGAHIEDIAVWKDTNTDAPRATTATPWGAYEAPGSIDAGHIGYGSLWNVATADTDAPLTIPDAPDAALCTCTIVESPDGTSETLVACLVCLAKLATRAVEL